MKANQTQKSKTAKIVNAIVNALVILIAIVVLIVAITSIASLDKGYNSYFGYAAVAVRSESMDGDRADSFRKGDMLFVKILTDEERVDLKVGDVVTFWDMIDGKKALNTHRIIDLNEMRDQETGALRAKQYVTRGDNAPSADMPIDYTSVVGKYTGNRAAGLGSIALFVQGSIGFLCLVVVPSLLLLIYAVVRLILTVAAMKKEKKAAEFAALTEGAPITDEQREAIRREILKELDRGANPDNNLGANPDGNPGANPDGNPGANPDGNPGANPDGNPGANPDAKPDNNPGD